MKRRVAPHPGAVEKRNRLGDPDVRRWFENLGRGSAITADHYLRSLFNFCRVMRVGPGPLVKLPDERLHDLLLDFVAREEKRGLAGSATLTYVKAVKSWLAFHGRRVDRPIKVRDSARRPTLDQKVPNPDELRRIVLAATLQQRAALSFVAFAGLRLETVGDYHGDDGLRIADLPGLSIRSGRAVFGSKPAMVVVRPELSKAGHRYFSFLGSEGCSYVQEYLEWRMARGEKLGPQSDVLHPRSMKKKFLRSVNVSECIKAPIVRAGFTWRPYDLRHYFDTQLLLSESKGRVVHDYRVFWMGHKGSIEHQYTTNRGALPEALVEDMRKAYARCEGLLSTVTVGGEKTEIAEAFVRAFMARAGYTADEIKNVDVSALTPEQYEEILTKGLGREGADSGPKQQVIQRAELPRYLAEGWVAKMSVDEDQFVVERAG